MNELGIALIWCTVQVTLLATVGTALYGLARRRSVGAGAPAALGSLLVIVALSLLALSPWPRWTLAAWAPERSASALGESLSAAVPSDVAGDRVEINIGEADKQPVESQRVVTSAFLQALWSELRHAPVQADAERWRWPATLAVVFLVAVGLGLVRLVFGLTAIRYYRTNSRPIADRRLIELAEVLRAELSCLRSVELRETSLLATAATIGWRRPLVLLPVEWTRWTREERLAVLAHELAHVVRGDFLAWVGAQLALVLHFYHPLVHWLARRLRLEQELAADAVAARLAGGERSYLTTLAEMALRQPNRPLAWPAQTFLPTRRTFLRRIEMLRDSKNIDVRKSSHGVRLATVGALVVAGLLVAGIRAPRGTAMQAAVAAQPDTKDEQRFDLSFVPADAAFALACKPAAMFNEPALKSAQPLLTEFFGSYGIPVEQIDQFTITGLFLSDGTYGFTTDAMKSSARIILRTNQPIEPSTLRAPGAATMIESRFEGHSYFHAPDGRQPLDYGYFLPDRRTAVMAAIKDIQQMISSGNAARSAPEWIGKEVSSASGQIIFAVNGQSFPFATQRTELIGGYPLQMIAPILEETKTVVGSIDISGGLKANARAICSTPAGAEKVAKTLEALKTLASNTVDQVRRGRTGAERNDEVIASLAAAAEQLLAASQIEQSDVVVNVKVDSTFDTAGELAALFSAGKKARDAARSMQSKNHLKQIALALHNYQDARGHFPPAVLYGPDGKTPHSWRVAILPYMEQSVLYDRYHLDEPWDSPHNLTLAKEAPAVFRHPQELKSTNTAYFVLTGPKTVFSGKEGVKLGEIKDGTANTLMVIEARRDVPWTKPEDIPYAADKPVPKLGGYLPGGFYAALCDGSIIFLHDPFNEAILRLLITKADGQPVDQNALR